MTDPEQNNDEAHNDPLGIVIAAICFGLAVIHAAVEQVWRKVRK